MRERNAKKRILNTPVRRIANVKTLFLHALERTIGSQGEIQPVPSLKEVLAWDSDTTSATNSIYSQLILLKGKSTLDSSGHDQVPQHA